MAYVWLTVIDFILIGQLYSQNMVINKTNKKIMVTRLHHAILSIVLLLVARIYQ